MLIYPFYIEKWKKGIVPLYDLTKIQTLHSFAHKAVYLLLFLFLHIQTSSFIAGPLPSLTRFLPLDLPHHVTVKWSGLYGNN